MSSAALEGIRVLDLSQIMAGPFCAMLLADLGAEVIKVEKPLGGDDSRRMGPPYYNQESAAFMAVNRNKYGLAVDIRTSAGKELLRRLLATADILIENFRPGTLERLGFGYEELHAQYPQLIYCSISGFGHTGPYRDRGGFDLVTQAMSGLLSVTGTPSEVAKVGVPISDLNAGLFASHAILAALFHRMRTGEGQNVETSLFEGALAYTLWESNEYWATRQPPQRLGTAHRLSAPYQVFQTADSWIAIGASNQRNWERLVQVLERPELLQDPLFTTNSDRMLHLPALVETLTETFTLRTTEEWQQRMDTIGVPAGPVLTLDQVYEHPQVQAREMDLEIDHPVAGRVHALGFPVKYSSTPGNIYRPAPVLGQHSCQIVQDLGYSAEECRLLETEGILYDAHL
jgi:crotonobetainyl-CoA:carnitine CoA-transferase CaiB-like acyl-CoA transferase